MVRAETDAVPFYSPVNEISFFSWGGGDVQYLNPFARGRGLELKVQLVRAALAAIDAIRAVDPRARFVHCDPMISITADPARPQDVARARGHHEAQYQAWDMICGAAWPQLGGSPEALDIIGVNYYSNNQWVLDGPVLDIGHELYRPVRRLLAENFGRYGRPLFIAETGTENDRRAAWLRYIHGETCAALAAGVPIEGICLYPVVNHPGWDDDRACQNGLLEAEATPCGRRVYGPLAEELARCDHRASAHRPVKRRGLVINMG